jgi:signal transduction histidine kinase
LFGRYEELTRYVGWSPTDEARVRTAGPALRSSFAGIVDDFYAEILRHPKAAQVITGGDAQIVRLKQTLMRWLEELFFGQRDEDYVVRRWQVGLRHVQIGLDQIYVNAAMSRIRSGLLAAHAARCTGPAEELVQTRFSINRLVDLDLALIEDAYQAEYVAWQNREERQKLLEAERLAAIGETMAGLVHESRNALQRTRACLEMLALDLRDRPQSLNLVERIQIAQNDLHQLFEEVREYAAPLKLHRSSCNLTATWRQVWEDLANLHNPKSLTLVEPAGSEPCRCVVDRFALAQAFRNVLENAIQASPRCGQVTIAASRASTAGGGGGIVIVIRDEGPGIPATERQRVFEPFFTTKTKGTGLGLAIARRIIDSHGGRIEIGEPPNGTEISIHLPQAGR